MRLPFLKKEKYPANERIAIVLAIIFLAGIGIGYLYHATNGLDDKTGSSGLPNAKKSAPGGKISTGDETAKFDAAIDALDSSEKLVEYIKSNISVSNEFASSALPPQELFAKRSGGPQDIAVFAAYVLDQHGYESGVFEYAFNENGQEKYNAVAVFRDGDTPKYLIATKDDTRLIAHGWSFRDLAVSEEKRKGIIITKYAFFKPGEINLKTDDWAKKQ